MDDINRRLTQQIQELHLDERLATSKELLNKHLATGQKKVSTAFNNLWADIEVMREAQRRRHEEQKANGRLGPNSDSSTTTSGTALPSPSTFSISGSLSSPDRTPTFATTNTGSRFDSSATRGRAPDLSHAQASVSAASHKAGAYISSWGTWASERRKGWAKSKTGDNVPSSITTTGPNAGEMSGGSPNTTTTRQGSTASRQEARSEEATEGRRTVMAGKMTSLPKRKSASREERGGDGIGRLDA